MDARHSSFFPMVSTEAARRAWPVPLRRPNARTPSSTRSPSRAKSLAPTMIARAEAFPVGEGAGIPGEDVIPAADTPEVDTPEVAIPVADTPEVAIREVAVIILAAGAVA